MRGPKTQRTQSRQIPDSSKLCFFKVLKFRMFYYTKIGNYYMTNANE